MTGRRVHLLAGGTSGEREVSLRTGVAVEAALRDQGFEVHAIDVGCPMAEVLARLDDSPGSVVFNALHGGEGENGAIQGLLECAERPYTHSGVLASALAMHKPTSRLLFEGAGIPIADGRVVRRACLDREDPVPRPYVIKPLAGGSSIGVQMIEQGTRLPTDVDGDEEVLVERYIPGRELTVAVLGGESLGVLEIRPREGFYDYQNKYESETTEYRVPAPVPGPVSHLAEEVARRAHAVLGCRGLTRADFRYDEAGDALVLLEVNTQPGLTETSLVPRISEYAGITFGELCAWMVEDASCAR